MLMTGNPVVDNHIRAREGIEKLFNSQLESILNRNKSKDKYWILGKINHRRKGDKYLMQPFLQACDEKPALIRQSFVYEVDNRRGVKTLLWVMHPGDTLSFPTLNKSIRVTNGEKGSTILLPKDR